jgi:hypothetical protein
VRERAERIHNLARMTAAGIVQIGQFLTEVKERLKHGKFLEWIEREFGWVERSAQRFMGVYQHVKCDKLSDLEIDVSALYLIAAPKTPEPVRAAIICRAENGETITHAGARAMVKHFAETGEIPDIQTSLPELIKECRQAMQLPEPQRKTVEDRNEEQQTVERRKANSARAAALLSMMSVIESIECIATTEFSMAEVARDIKCYDTPDQDWRGDVKEAASRLSSLRKELEL